MKNVPLSIILENARGMMNDAFNQVQNKSKLPSYLLEGIVIELLLQVRSQKNLELISDMNEMQQKEQGTEETEGKGEE